MKKSFLTALLLGVAITAATPTVTYAKPYTPARGSAERTGIMKAMHRVLGSGKHKPLITARTFNVEKGWVYLSGDFEYADGAPLEEHFREGSGTNFSAVLHYEGKGKSAGWKVKTRIYHGDYILDELKRKFPNAPRAIFKDE